MRQGMILRNTKTGVKRWMRVTRNPKQQRTITISPKKPQKIQGLGLSKPIFLGRDGSRGVIEQFPNGHKVIMDHGIKPRSRSYAAMLSVVIKNAIDKR